MRSVGTDPEDDALRAKQGRNGQCQLLGIITGGGANLSSESGNCYVARTMLRPWNQWETNSGTWPAALASKTN